MRLAETNTPNRGVCRRIPSSARERAVLRLARTAKQAMSVHIVDAAGRSSVGEQAARSQIGFSDRRLGKGFTLVEMLATLLIIALVLPTAMRGIALVTRIASLSNRKIMASTFAESKISELIASGEWARGGLSRGNFGDDYPEYVWDIDVKNWTEAPMSELRVSVYWDGGRYDEDRCVTLTTLVYAKDE